MICSVNAKLLTALALASARLSTVILDPTSIKGLASLDVLRSAQALGVGRRRKTTLIAQAGHGRGKSGDERNEASGMHDEIGDVNVKQIKHRSTGCQMMLYMRQGRSWDESVWVESLRYGQSWLYIDTSSTRGMN